MVKIRAFTPLVPKNPAEFCTNPYDVIEKEEELALKKNPNSLVHLILPDGDGDIQYENAAKQFKRYLNGIKKVHLSLYLLNNSSQATLWQIKKQQFVENGYLVLNISM